MKLPSIKTLCWSIIGLNIFDVLSTYSIIRNDPSKEQNILLEYFMNLYGVEVVLFLKLISVCIAIYIAYFMSKIDPKNGTRALVFLNVVYGLFMLGNLLVIIGIVHA